MGNLKFPRGYFLFSTWTSFILSLIHIYLTDQQITIGDPYVRIVGKRTYLDRLYTPEIELSNEIEPPSELTRVLNELDRQADGLASRIDLSLIHI